MLEPNLLGRFTNHLKEALQKALAFAVSKGRDRVEPGDVLVGLLTEKGSIAAEILQKSKVGIDAAKEQFAGKPDQHEPGAPIAPDLAPVVKRLLEKCILTAHLHEHKYVGTEHLLFAMLDMPLKDVHGFLEEQGVNMDFTREQIVNVLKSTSRFPEVADEEQLAPGLIETNQHQPEKQDTPKRAPREKRVKALEVFARELTAPDIVSTLDPVIGREEETNRVIEILCRRSKNNPILLGEPGVGKTAVVEGLAQRLAAGNVPEPLQGRRVYAVDLALIIAGTMYRGEFEARLKQLVDEAKQDPNTLLFIDEIHNIVGAGSTSGSLDAANILKPALARGEIHCIGATTWAEYKKHIETDAALERRYQSVEIHEPEPDLTLVMLQGLKKKYEDHHSVRYTPEAVEAAVRLSHRYLTDRFFPDKAIDVLDEAAALVSTRRAGHEDIERLRALDIAIDASLQAKDQAIESGDMQKASEAQADEERLQAEMRKLEKKIESRKQKDRLTVEKDQVIQVIARLARVPIEAVVHSDRDQLYKLETRLGERIFGQDDAIFQTAETVKKAQLGLSDPSRPKASFMFVGPSGVGKTALARTLAEELFGKQDALIKMDMSEFAEGHAVSKLLGSPAGYVGYREGNNPVELIRRRPHSIILFDEFEKAHPAVQHLLLQALEDGTIRDSTNRLISLRHAYIILTSNVGADYVHKSEIGFDKSGNRFEQMVHSQLKEQFRPELLNRLDRVVIFKPLGQESLKQILKRELQEVLDRLKETQKVAYSVSDEVLDFLLKKEMKSEDGARAARHLVEREIISPLGSMLVKKPNKRKGSIKVSKNKIQIT